MAAPNRDNEQCPTCGHPMKDHVIFVKSMVRAGYREVKGKKRYGGCSYMHGVPGHFCTCKGEMQ